MDTGLDRQSQPDTDEYQWSTVRPKLDAPLVQLIMAQYYVHPSAELAPDSTRTDLPGWNARLNHLFTDIEAKRKAPGSTGGWLHLAQVLRKPPRPVRVVGSQPR